MTRRADFKVDCLAAVRTCLRSLYRIVRTTLLLCEYTTIDKKLESFRGGCSFRQYIPSKSAKHIFSWDAELVYSNNLEIYAGKQPEGPFTVSNKSTDPVRRLCEQYCTPDVTLQWISSVM